VPPHDSSAASPSPPEEIDLDTLPDPDGSTFWHPDYFEPFADEAPYPTSEQV
jgi:hypothetical protein